MTITTHTHQRLRRIAEDARDNREKAVITPDQLDDLLDAATASPRPLTPDAITDEMVHRAGEAYMWNDTRGSRAAMAAALTAALTPPPKRPEGAEDIEVLLFDAGVDENRAEVANYLASRLTDPTRKEA